MASAVLLSSDSEQSLLPERTARWCGTPRTPPPGCRPSGAPSIPNCFRVDQFRDLKVSYKIVKFDNPTILLQVLDEIGLCNAAIMHYSSYKIVKFDKPTILLHLRQR